MDTHLKGIGVENFRIFQDFHHFNFAPITVLTGTNSSGKSSLVNLLSLLKESYSNYNTYYYGKDIREMSNQNLFEFFPPISEEFIFKTFGSFAHLTNNKNESKNLSFTTLKGNLPGYEDSISLSIKYNFETGPSYCQIESIEIFISIIEESEIICFFRNFLREHDLLEYTEITNAKILWFELDKDGDPNKYDCISRCQYDILYLLYISYRLFHFELFKKIKTLETKLNANDNEEIRNEIKKYLESKKIFFYAIRNVKDNHEVKLAIDIYDSVLEEFKQQPITNYKDENNIIDTAEFSFLEEHGKYYINSKLDLSFINVWCENDPIKINAINKYLNKFYGKEDIFTCHLNFQLDFLKFIFERFGFISTSSHFLKYLSDHEEHYSVESLKNKQSFNLKYLKDLLFPILDIVLKDNETLKKIDLHSSTNFLEDSKPENAFFNKMVKGIYSQIFGHLDRFKKIQMITNKRAFDERQYTIKSRKELYLLKDLNKEKNKSHLSNIIKQYILDFEIAEDIKFEIDEEMMMCKILLMTKGKWVNVKDEGFGISKLIPLILSIQPEYDRVNSEGFKEAIYAPVIIIIEEPESNLHPALQSKLADLFVDLSKRFNIQFIIETHSEYLIRKLQYLTAKKEIKPSDTQLYYFHHPERIPEGEKQIYPINIREDGSLTKNFGTGFFDEAGAQELKLYQIIKEKFANGSSLN